MRNRIGNILSPSCRRLRSHDCSRYACNDVGDEYRHLNLCGYAHFHKVAHYSLVSNPNFWLSEMLMSLWWAAVLSERNFHLVVFLDHA